MYKNFKRIISLLLVCVICLSFVNGPIDIIASAGEDELCVSYENSDLLKSSVFTDGVEKVLFPIDNTLYMSRSNKKLDKDQAGETGGHGYYAFDFCNGSKNVRAPFTGKVVSKQTGGSHTIFFQSKDKVLLANGKIDYVTVVFCHDNDISDIVVYNDTNKKYYKQGEVFYQQGTYMKGKSGQCGRHLHIEIAIGLYSTLSDVRANGIHVNEAMFVPESVNITKGYIKENCTKKTIQLNWVRDTISVVPIDQNLKAAVDKACVRSGPYDTYSVVKKLSLGTEVHAVGYFVNIYSNKWYKLDDGNWIYSKRVTDLPSKKVSVKQTSSTQKMVESKVKSKTTVTTFPSPKVVTENSKYVIPGPAPKADGYTFLGYSKKENATTAEYKIGDSITITNDLVLYPVWKKTSTTMDLSSYNESFNISKNQKTSTVKISCSGKLNKDYKISVKSDNTNVVTASVSGNDYSGFALWDELTANLNITAKSGGKAYLAVSVANSSGSVLATKTIYVSVGDSYTVNYYVDGVKKQNQTKNFNKNLELLTYTPEKDKYSFMGWTTVSGSTTVEYGPGDLYKNNAALNLYAVWEENIRIDSPSWDESTKTLTITGKGDMPCYPSGKIPWTDYASKAEKLVIGSGITSIGSNAFSGFTKLKKVTLPYGIVKICNNAFSQCSSLSEINFPASVSVIGNKAFNGCAELAKVLLPQSEPLQAASLESDFGSQLEIGAYAFEDCVSLASIEIPDSVSELGAGAFSGCSGLEEVTISEGLTTIEDNTFFNCSSIESVNIPDNITTVGDGAFSGCSSAQEIIISEGVEEIGDQAFSGCSALEEVAIPSSIETIGAGVFSACSMLSDVDLPDNLGYVGDAMFSGCSALDSIDLPDEIEYIGDGAFRDCSALTEIDIPESVNSINDDTFWGCSSLEEVILPESITSLGEYAFCSCEELTDVSLNEGLSSIGVCAFAFCSSLETIAIPATITNIDIGSFMECASLKNVEILESSVSIGDYAFVGCSALEEIYLPEGTVSLGEDVFADCSASLEISCFSSSSVFDQVTDTYENVDAIVPVESISIDREELTIDIENTDKLIGTVYPSNATCTDVTWRSDNEAVATVDSTGNITAVSGGTATITVTSNDGLFTASCFVTVNVPVKGIEFYYNDDTAYVGDELELDYLFAPENPTNINASLTSSDETVAVVNEEGIIKFIGAGTADITITSEDGGYSDVCQIKCENYISATEINLDKAEISLSIGETAVINAQFVPENATNKLTKVIIEDTDIVVVDEDGNILALKAGTTSLYIANDECDSDICTVTVLEEHSHSYSAVITAPTCTEKGYTTYTCSCGNSYKADYVDPTGHSFAEGSFSWNENHSGCNLIVPCQKCSYQDVKACEITNEEINPTCVLDGKIIYSAVCTYSGKVYSDSVEEKSVSATGHRFVGGECEVCHVKQEEAALSDAKTLAVSELIEARKNFVSDEAKAAINAAISTIENATSPEAIATAKSNGLTTADNAENVLATAKTNAINAIEAAKSAAKTEEAKSILENAKAAINSATSINAVNLAKSDAVSAANSADQAYAEKIKYDKIKIWVPDSRNVDYRSILTITATASDVPADCKLVMYINGSESVTGNSVSVSYAAGELKSNINYTIKVVDKDGHVVKDSSGNEISKDGGKITCKSGFIQKLVAFFKGLFGALPKVEVKP